MTHTIAGVVYNITLFAKYHPGGKPQLMRGAGNDCTELFDKVRRAQSLWGQHSFLSGVQVHVWVNSEAILEKCVVGYLVGAKPREFREHWVKGHQK